MLNPPVVNRLGANIARQKLHHIVAYGSMATVGAVKTHAKRKPIALTSVAQHFSSRDGGGPIIDPAIYEVPSLDFLINGVQIDPQPLQTLIWHGGTNKVHRVDADLIADTLITYHLVACRALLAVDANNNPLSPCETVHHWTPQTQAQRTDSVTKKLKDTGFTDAGKVIAYLEPFTDTEKLMAGGSMDTREVRVFTSIPLALKDVIVRADGTAWAMNGPSEVFPSTGDQRGIARHLAQVPAGVSF
ncbi:hypothetical protein CCAX7_54610 [Capsulimonas corticalis]|uniref:Uncharacterized protein n=1 Tax=Capsulimonas corticalis TaxID=2219043 RepID=A0A402D5R8_9BACT|nr:hypothetical protein [Capsulimonas corticalis]BDI33410.1 hypothetical protein CCAX7_54610 [Capsulimonas corticalis]